MTPSVFISHTTRDRRDSVLAERLAAALLSSGAKVWIAPVSIPAGARWEASIVTGILRECSHFVVILSAASAHAEWVEREVELARQRQLGDASFTVLPLFVGDVDHYPNGDFIAKLQRVPYYDDAGAQFDALARAIGLRPPVSEALSAFVAEKTRDFFGREYVFNEIDSFIAAQSRGYFTIVGDPGIGKTAIIASLVRRTGCIAHFNSRAQGITTAAQFLESVCSQLIVRYGLPYTSLPPDALRDGAFFARLLTSVAASLAPGERLTIAVDALDEVTFAGDAANVLFLPTELPAGVYFVMSRRPGTLPFSVQAPQRVLDMDAFARESLADVGAYVRRAITLSPKLATSVAGCGLTAESFSAIVAERSQGNFMYVRYILPDIERGLYPGLVLDQLPLGLETYYEDHWRRMGMTEKPLPRLKIRVVYVLSVLQRPGSRKLIASFSNDASTAADELSVQEVLDEWDQFLHEQRESGTLLYSIYHASFRDFLHRKEIVRATGESLEAIHGRIADDLWGELFASG